MSAEPAGVWSAALDDSDRDNPVLSCTNVGTATADRSTQSRREANHILRSVISAGSIRTVSV